eukprot:363374-Chlamydomonas_euryale.AAC.8
MCRREGQPSAGSAEKLRVSPPELSLGDPLSVPAPRRVSHAAAPRRAGVGLGLWLGLCSHLASIHTARARLRYSRPPPGPLRTRQAKS